MEDLLSVVVFVLYLIAVTAAGKNKKNKKKKQKNDRQRKPQFERAFEQLFESMAATEHAKEEKADPSSLAPHDFEGEDPCHDSMLGKSGIISQYNTVSQVEMHTAGEGEDPCHENRTHDDNIREEESPVYRSPIFDTEDQEAFAKDVLRGAIMSEILQRPTHQRIGAGIKRRA